MNEKARIRIEQIIICSALKSQKDFLYLIENVTDKEYFLSPLHRLLFTSMLEIYYELGKTPTFSLFFEYLLKIKSDIIIKDYLQNEIISTDIKTSINSYLDALITDNINREINEELETFKKLKYSGIELAEALSDTASNIISKYQRTNSDVISNKIMGEIVIKNIEKARNGEPTDYFSTGFKTIDKYIIGIPKKHLTIIASRPGMGKSQFMLQLLRNFRKQGIKTGIFSLEMDKESLWHRNLSAETGINSIKIETGELNEEELLKVKKAAAELSTDDYILDDNGTQTPESIKARINLWKVKHLIDVVIIDYLTLLNHKYEQDRNDLNIGKLTSELRIFAKQSGIPIIILSQLNRAVESRTDKRPILSDLRESGSIEQDAKLVMFLHRPVYYGVDPFIGPNSLNLYTKEGNRLDKQEYCEILIRKARSGKTGIVPLRVILEQNRFEELSERCL